MTIKQYGGVFGRNPTFNDVTIEGQLTFDGDIDINSDLKVSGDIETTGNVIIATSGKGIDFSATAGPNPPASGTSELLDDYEEGTWTPVLEGATSAGSGTYSFQAGNYTKVGNLVVATGRISFSSHTGTGNMQLHGLPFTSSGTGLVEPACVIYGSDITLTANNYMVATVKRSDTYVEILQTPVGGGSGTAVTMGSGGALHFTVTYQAS